MRIARLVQLERTQGSSALKHPVAPLHPHGRLEQRAEVLARGAAEQEAPRGLCARSGSTQGDGGAEELEVGDRDDAGVQARAQICTVGREQCG